MASGRITCLMMILKKVLKHFLSYYLTEMKPFLKRSGVVLAGWSFGGSVALEIAHLLELEGIKVHALFLLDSFARTEHRTLTMT